MNSHPEVDEMIREQDRFFEAIEFSDDRLADRFVGSVYEHVKYVPHLKQWIFFRENRWHLDEDAYHVIREIKDFCFEQASRAWDDGDQAAALRILSAATMQGILWLATNNRMLRIIKEEAGYLNIVGVTPEKQRW